ncbi:MAG TPA: M20/M25/M40 family metallo-hydrolase, partial [Clostridiales bacterium]|nr:M20/M25/M40 family metallo-hydrolase [Clostridiales bacterium]
MGMVPGIPEINELVEGHRQQIIDLVCRLVNIPTENNPPVGYEFEGQNLLKDIFRKLDMELDEFAPDEIEDYKTNPAFLKGRDYKNRKNIVALWRGIGQGRSILLSGHMDVAPKEPLPWKICQPYSSVVKEGRIYGRGSCDMKGGLVCAVMAVKILKNIGWQPKGDVIVESVVDEEYASGNGTIASRLRGHNADFAINLEPTGLRISPACVGGLVYKISIIGEGGMPYTGDEIYNPAYGIADMINIIREFAKERLKGVDKPRLWKNAPQQPQVIITKVKAGEVGPYGQLGIPSDSWMEVVVQTYPGQSEEDITEELRSFIRGRLPKSIGILIERLYRYIEPVGCDRLSDGVKALKDSADKFLDKEAVICAA